MFGGGTGLEQHEQQGKTCIGYGSHKDYVTWLTGIHNRITAADLPEGFVQEAFYLRNGGQYEDTRYDAGEAVNVKRYWISL